MSLSRFGIQIAVLEGAIFNHFSAKNQAANAKYVSIWTLIFCVFSVFFSLDFFLAGRPAGDD